ncbi:DNA-3-methyladenine glycosylase family protein [Naasia aerilata]|uniref:DNA-3-methyladenine glycosylase family protein n=1 Tax=Naasia aerilata TaxID=1162966 RepID=UPI002574273E|nr:DNA-3-methyladenine glycosylase 2 family protein [Naasia aerilata]
MGATGTATAAPTPPAVAVTTVYEPRERVNLSLVLSQLGRGPGDPTFAWDRTGRHGVPGAWRTLLTPEGAATMHLAQSSSGSIHARAWGPGAGWAIDGVPELCGAGDDLSGLDLSGAPALAEAARRLPGLRLARVGLVFEMLIAAILEQKVTIKEAHSAWRILVRRHGEAAPGPAPDGMRVFPTPDAWRHIPSWEWHRAGVDPRRSRTCVEASRVAAGLERTLSLGRGGPEVHSRLRSVNGVGVWTAAETSQRAHGDADEVSVGDFHLHDLIGWALAGQPVDDDGMLELLEPYRGHRQRVVRIILASGFRKPRFGPRITIQDHRGH